MERPIILKAHEVRGILDGRQTQLRRIIKPQPYGDADFFHIEYGNQKFGGPQAYLLDVLTRYGCPFGQVGDRLWGRETWQAFDKDGDTVVAWKATCQNDEFDYWCGNQCERLNIKKWRSSAVMPRVASRILMEIVCVRVERLQDISEADALDSGVWYEQNLGYTHNGEEGSTECPSDAFADRWDSDHGDGSWKANPFVWCITFRRVS